VSNVGGNPKGISSLAGLARPVITMVNREPGAGSRPLVDLYLQKAGAVPTRVNGYRHEASSHLQVTDAVALASGLDFLRLQEERYDLVIPLEFLNAPAVRAMLDVAVSRQF
jgi:putative molybdopterin biosynthesis protein